MTPQQRSADRLTSWVREARARSLALVADLSDRQCAVPRRPIVTPFVWELGHVGWFQEKWLLRHVHGRAPMVSGIDAMYDSAAIPHPARWDLAQLSRPEVLRYLRDVENEVLAILADHEPDASERYFAELSVFHEDMHAEAFTYMRQTLAYPGPSFCSSPEHEPSAPCVGDVSVPGGRYRLGAPTDAPFAFDNEKWAHEVDLKPFAISRTCVTEADFAVFVGDRGYQRPELWSDAGWHWCQCHGATMPAYWRRMGSGFERRTFDRWLPIATRMPVVHVNWFEADAWCRWAGRRLPSEAEWELAASGYDKSPLPWPGDQRSESCANLTWRSGGCTPVDAEGPGDSPFGCRQMIGNVWEWTSSTFEPFPGFVPDPYKEYSQPFFGSRKVLRGGSWATASRMIRTTWRNYFEPHRSDIIAGFRTCAADR